MDIGKTKVFSCNFVTSPGALNNNALTLHYTYTVAERNDERLLLLFFFGEHVQILQFIPCVKLNKKCKRNEMKRNEFEQQQQ